MICDINMSMQAEDYIRKGNNLALKDKLKQAEVAYKKAIELEGDNVLAWGNLGVVQEKMGQDALAEESIRKAVSLAPDYGRGFYNLGMLLVKTRRPEEAIEYLEKAVELSPDSVDYIFNQGVNLQRLGKISEQIKSFEKVSDLNPDYPEIYYWLWLAYRRIALWDKISSIELMLEIGVEHDPFINIVRSEDPLNNLEVAMYASSKFEGKIGFGHKRGKGEKIRLGYFSNDLREHPVGQMVSGMFELHDRSRFEVIAFSTEKDGSKIQKKISQSVDEFVDLSDRKLTDGEIARSIRDRKIDILVEMTGHTKDNRFGACAFRPAPIQVEWLGFPGTTGASFMDYALVDKVIAPKSHQTYFTEKLIYLPHCYQINTPQKISTKKFARSGFGLPEEGFIFGSFNQVFKIDSVIFDTWMSILKQVPGSVLWLWGQHKECIGNLKREAEARGVNPDRIVFSKSERKDKHLARLRFTDLALDTLIYGGHTTTTDYLWAGVPVVTRLGKHFASRVGASILTEVGLAELVVRDLREYENLAVKIANDPKKLKDLKSKLTHEKLEVNLFNTRRFVRNLEEAYEKMWKEYT